MEYNNPKIRPLYTELAWAYDRIIQKPTERWALFIASQLSENGVQPPERILDAGCGTGEYVLALARCGYQVTGIDISQEMVDVARAKVGGANLAVEILVGDFLTCRFEKPFGAVLCRGVLNDLLSDAERERTFVAFHEFLRPGGALILDARDWEKTVESKARNPVFEKYVAVPEGELVFRSEVKLDHERHLQVIQETSRHRVRGESMSSSCRFVMRCWSVPELTDILNRHGFDVVQLLGDYDASVAVGSTDRIIAMARRV